MRAEMTKGGVVSADRDILSRDGGAASTTWAFVPPKPKELTPAYRRSRAALISSASRTSLRFNLSNAMLGFGVSQCNVGGTIPRSRARAAFSKPAIPDAGSR